MQYTILSQQQNVSKFDINFSIRITLNNTFIIINLFDNCLLYSGLKSMQKHSVLCLNLKNSAKFIFKYSN